MDGLFGEAEEIFRVAQETIFSIILAGGRGTRMRSDATHKVCFEVGGVPVIL